MVPSAAQRLAVRIERPFWGVLRTRSALAPRARFSAVCMLCLDTGARSRTAPARPLSLHSNLPMALFARMEVKSWPDGGNILVRSRLGSSLTCPLWSWRLLLTSTTPNLLHRPGLSLIPFLTSRLKPTSSGFWVTAKAGKAPGPFRQSSVGSLRLFLRHTSTGLPS